MSTAWDAAVLERSPLVATLEVHEELGSTNDRAKQLASTNASLPALVIASSQTAGRGRGANRWWASEGALTFSLLIDPIGHGIEASQQGLLSLATAVAVIDAVQQTAGMACGYKWPNDVLLDGKKLAGILIESPRPDRLVIGVGINVENRFDDAPTEVQARATSLDGSEAVRQQVLVAFLNAFSKRLTQLASADPSPLEAARAACVLTGKSVTLRDSDRSTQGVCCGLADDGALRMLSDSGESHYYSGSIERW